MFRKYLSQVDLRINANKAARISCPSSFRRSLQLAASGGNSFEIHNPPIKQDQDQQVIGSVTNNNIKSSKKSFMEELLADAVTPLWRISYLNQLKIKDQHNFDLLKKLTAKLKKESPSQILCQLLPTVPSVNMIFCFYNY